MMFGIQKNCFGRFKRMLFAVQYEILNEYLWFSSRLSSWRREGIGKEGKGILLLSKKWFSQKNNYRLMGRTLKTSLSLRFTSLQRVSPRRPGLRTRIGITEKKVITTDHGRQQYQFKSIKNPRIPPTHFVEVSWKIKEPFYRFHHEIIL